MNESENTCFTAGDMADAQAKAFREGQASKQSMVMIRLLEVITCIVIIAIAVHQW